jgi:hypothetical protein
MTSDTTEMSKEKKAADVTDAEIIEETTAEEQSWSERLTSSEHWLRFVFMVLFAVISGVVSYLLTALVILQFVWGLVTGDGNEKLRKLGSSMAQYIYQVLRYLTYNTEDKPFPFADWPESEESDD